METNNSKLKKKLMDLLMDSLMEFHESLEEDKGLCYVSVKQMKNPKI